MGLIFSAMFYYWYNAGYGFLAMVNLAAPLGFISFSFFLYRDTFRKNRMFLLALLFFLWYILTRFLNGDFFLEGVRFNLPFLCIALCVALPLSEELPLKRRRYVETSLGLFIVGFFTLLAMISLYATVTNHLVQLPKATFTIGIDATMRLEVWEKQANIMGGLFSVCFLIAVFIYSRLGHKLLLLIPLLGICASLYLAIGLTTSRTSMISLSVSIGLILATLLLKNAVMIMRPLRLAVSLVVFIVVSLALYKGFGMTNAMINRLSTSSNAMSAISAAAETMADTQSEPPAVMAVANQRDFSDLWTFNGRTQIYAATIQAIRDNPKTLLIGNLDENIMQGINPYLPEKFAHTHSSFLQTLMCCGVVGLALMLWFIGCLLKTMWHLAFAKNATVSDLVLAVIPLVLLLHSLFEPFIFIYYDVINFIFFLFSGMIVSRVGETTTAPSAQVVQA